MSTTNVSTPIPSGLTEEQVLAALHNHDLMIKTLCPALISYEFESGDATSQAVYSVTDKKPIGQVSPAPTSQCFKPLGHGSSPSYVRSFLF
jgi:hypothetical protein